MTLSWLKKEVKRTIPIFCFFLFSFSLVNFAELQMLSKDQYTPFTILQISLAALVVAKAAMLTNIIWSEKWTKKLAIIWQIALKWILLSLVIFLMRCILRVFEEKTIADLDIHRMLILQIWYSMLLFIYLLYDGINHRIAKGKLLKLLFTPLKDIR